MAGEGGGGGGGGFVGGGGGCGSSGARGNTSSDGRECEKVVMGEATPPETTEGFAGRAHPPWLHDAPGSNVAIVA